MVLKNNFLLIINYSGCISLSNQFDFHISLNWMIMLIHPLTFELGLWGILWSAAQFVLGFKNSILKKNEN